MDIYNVNDKNYPQKLADIANPPKKLYVLGQLPSYNKKTVAIVGARECSYYGRKMAYEYAKILAAHGVQIISGLAKGIDCAAHQGALDAGEKTFAVLGCGVDICYPASNRPVYEQIKNNGGIISEFSPEEKPLAWHFPLRNRIISGFADMVLIIEAREKSGSLITADAALEQGKDVYALPGRVSDELSGGCNRLISQGAGIAWSVDELLVALYHRNFENKKDKMSDKTGKQIVNKNNSIDIEKEKHFRQIIQKRNSGLESTEKKVYSCISLQPKHINEIVELTGMDLTELIMTLYLLEEKGCIIEITKNYYVLKNMS